MKQLKDLTDSAVSLASAVSALALPPTAFGLVPEWAATVPQFDLDIWASATVNLTNAVLYSGTRHPFTFADNVITSFTHATETVNKVAHGFLTGDGPVQLVVDGTGVVPTGLALLTDYYVIKLTADTYQLAESLELAMAGTPVPFSTAGTANVSLHATADTERTWWTSHSGLLGLASDGAIALTASTGYRKRIEHAPQAFAYALVATVSAPSVSASMTFVVDA